jgi:phospholipase D1/2
MIELTHPGQLTVFDVFLLDSDFKIERPTRYYRQGLHLLMDSSDDDDDDEEEKKTDKGKGKGKGVDRSLPRHKRENDTNEVHLTPPGDTDCMSTLGSIKSKISNVFKRKKALDPESPSRPSASGSGPSPRTPTDDTASTISSRSERGRTPILDPSTNTNPLLDPDEQQDHPHLSKKRPQDVSKHTFYIQNGQMKLRINAKNERLMLQWIAALEKAAAACHFTRRSRFDSFAPIRLNVAAQWLVDGVSCRPGLCSLSGLI